MQLQNVIPFKREIKQTNYSSNLYTLTDKYTIFNL